MADPIVDPSDLELMLGTPVDFDRATLLLELAEALCESVVAPPLPDAARAVVLSVAARAYANPQNAQSQSMGPYSASYSQGSATGGLYLSRQDRQTLQRLAGRGGAFTIDTMPATAGQNLAWWDTGAPGSGDVGWGSGWGGGS